MVHPSKRKGDYAELELAKLLADLTGWPVRRKLGAGRSDDTGDLEGVPDTTIQVKNYPTDLVRSLREGVVDLRIQHHNSGTTFAVCFIRRRGGHWLAIMEPDQWATWAREAIYDGWADDGSDRVLFDSHDDYSDVVMEGD